MPTFLHARYLAPETPYRDIPELKDKMICEENGVIPAPAPAANFSCVGPGYCEHKGVYCAGVSRKDVGDSTDDLKACEVACTNLQDQCNCASWAADHEGGAACRLYSGATTFEKSGNGFSAYVPPSSSRLAAELSNSKATVGGICLPQDPAVFKHMMQGVHNWKPFVCKLPQLLVCPSKQNSPELSVWIVIDTRANTFVRCRRAGLDQHNLWQEQISDQRDWRWGQVADLHE
jgi:hypothetical protein